jgi:CelD/BcsL family acetyltransferase involved in cellulose biosynthesis
MQSLKSNARRKLRRSLEQIEDHDQVYVTMAQTGDLEQRIETLLALWQERWGEKSALVLDGCRATFRSCFEHDSLYLATVWHTETPIAAVACLVDRIKSTFSGYICSWDPRFADMSPGILGWALSIQDAIKSGMKGYDFLRGDERYKYITFGAVDRFNSSVTITRPSLRITAQELLKRGVGILRDKSPAHMP